MSNLTKVVQVPIRDNGGAAVITEVTVPMTVDEILSYNESRRVVIADELLDLQETSVTLHNAEPPASLDATEATLVDQLK